MLQVAQGANAGCQNKTKDASMLLRSSYRRRSGKIFYRTKPFLRIHSLFYFRLCISQGLYIRVNLETGKKEAKLLE
ncbi:hypothetical protein AM587_10013329 [Phytophthora nicotianae]|uniref:Uncharacterized protein n=1 Tax=Phytophthora nicotianae TaxID=4792 RepID=A0A0W8C001_PHYNI|nr:hypothetical protein AM587_10013329 [Phytophthora nicotianae]